jgi:hypothetical protein
MKLKTYRWYDIALGLLPVLFPLWQFGQSWAGEKHQTGHQPTELLEFTVDSILSLKYVFPIALAIGIVSAYLVKLVREAAPRRTVRNFLNLIHEKHFPHEFGGRNPDCRVSVLVPTNKGKWKFIPYPSLHRYLVLYARSGDIFPKSRGVWDITESAKGHYDGVAGYAWVTGVTVDVSSLPEYNDASQSEYLERTFLSEKKAQLLNVLSRSYKAHVIQNKLGEKVGVIMMESKQQDGLALLTPQDVQEIARTLHVLFLS